MQTRLSVFNSYANHAWLSRLYSRLTRADIEFCEKFINENSALTKGDFEIKINRIFMDQRDKPKNWPLISELLTCANSASK